MSETWCSNTLDNGPAGDCIELVGLAQQENPMKLLFDLFPVLLFFVAFKLYGIYVATAVAIAASFVQVSLSWLKHRRVETMHLVTLAGPVLDSNRLISVMAVVPVGSLLMSCVTTCAMAGTFTEQELLLEENPGWVFVHPLTFHGAWYAIWREEYPA